jgi:predicted RNA polymerase sigma factor
MEPEETDRLRLIFTCCHPALNLEAQVALTLRTLGGLTTPEVARAFLMAEPALAQRAQAMAEGPEAGLALMAGLSLDDYRLYHAARADLLRRAGRLDAAAVAYRQAITLCANAVVGRHLERRLVEVTVNSGDQALAWLALEVLY